MKIYFYLLTAVKYIKNLFKLHSFILLNLCLIFTIDAIISDDEPLFEPIEWSLWQNWLLFLLIISWCAEVLISSTYGNYIGRDKRVWTALYKIYWLVQLYIMISLLLLTIFAIVPFYFELHSCNAVWISFWTWYNRIFLWKAISIHFILLIFAFLLQLNCRWMSYFKVLLFVILIILLLGILIYINLLVIMFLYFTNPITYNLNINIDYTQLSNGPNKWGWGSSTKDHFSYHTTPTVFWYKYDFCYASSCMIIQLFFTFSYVLLFIQMSIVFRKFYTSKIITYTLITYYANSIRIYFYYTASIYIFSVVSFIMILIRNRHDFLFML